MVGHECYNLVVLDASIFLQNSWLHVLPLLRFLVPLARVRFI